MDSTAVEIDLTEADVIEFSIVNLMLQRTLRKAILGWVAMIILLPVFSFVLWAVLRMQEQYHDICLKWVFIFVAGLFAVFYLPLLAFRYPLLRRFMARQFRNGGNSLLLGKKVVTLKDEGCRSVGDSTDSFVRWDAIQKFVRTTSAIYFYLTKASAFIVPMRSFANDSQYQEFFNFAKSNRPDAPVIEAKARPVRISP